MSAGHARTNLAYAIPFTLLAAFFTATSSAVAKYALTLLSTVEIVFARNLVGLVLFFGYLLLAHRGGRLRDLLRPKSLKMQLLRGVSGLASLTLFYYSLQTIPLSDAVVLFFTMPIFVPLTAFLWRGTKIHHKLWWGIGTAFLGIVAILKPGGEMMQTGSLSALLSGMVGSVATLSLRYAHETEPSQRTLLYYFLITTALSGLALPFDYGNWDSVLSTQGLFFLGAIGILGLFYQIFFTLSVKYAPARLITPFYYITVVFSMFLDRWLWHTAIDLFKVAGFFLVFIGVCLVVLLYPRTPPSARPGTQ
jgi:drug/metabolite transporter (DMT)-like permease